MVIRNTSDASFHRVLYHLLFFYYSKMVFKMAAKTKLEYLINFIIPYTKKLYIFLFLLFSS